MFDLIAIIQEQVPSDVFTDLELVHLIPGSPNRRHALVKRALASQKIIRLRRGLYYLGPRHRRHPLNLFALAQHIYPPSYLSCETALAHHGWIPEAVHSVVAACLRRSRSFPNVLGHFVYQHVTADPFLVGVTQEPADGRPYFMATPWKALADLVYIGKRDWRGIHPLIHSLRIDEAVLHKTSPSDVEGIAASYTTSRRVRRFLAGVRKDLHL